MQKPIKISTKAGSDGSFYWVFDELATLANENRDTVAPAVKAYVSELQNQLNYASKFVPSPRSTV